MKRWRRKGEARFASHGTGPCEGKTRFQFPSMSIIANFGYSNQTPAGANNAIPRSAK
jgi:hypothetical protein